MATTLSTITSKATSTTGKSPHRTLTSLLKYFVGLTLTVELKNGRQYKGELIEADNCMNISLVAAIDITNTTATISSPSFMELSIRGSTVKYIHFPDHCDIPLTIKTGQDRERRVTNKYQRGLRKAPAK